MGSTTKNKLVEAIIAALEIPPSYYEKAGDRYKDLGDWFGRKEARTYKYDPLIYAQGSFRLGTVIRPLHSTESFDLDMGCRLRQSLAKATHTQADLKKLVGDELEAYRKARNIQKKLDEKRRCWRCEYSDDLAFHMDVVPSIPEEMTKRASLAEAMIKRGSAKALAESVTHHSGNITDKEDRNFRLIHPDWRISNSEGYALWFESRIAQAPRQMTKLAEMAKAAKVEKLPAWKWKSPLQKALMFLKRHRDSMFADAPEGKPISVILTTLAGEAYRGEEDVIAAIDRILRDMDNYIMPTRPRIPNPVNPAEDFADKWSEPQNAHLCLEANFRRWLAQARADFRNIENLTTENDIWRFSQKKFGVQLSQETLTALVPFPAYEQKRVEIITRETTAKPWCP